MTTRNHGYRSASKTAADAHRALVAAILNARKGKS